MSKSDRTFDKDELRARRNAKRHQAQARARQDRRDNWKESGVEEYLQQSMPEWEREILEAGAW